MDNGVLNEIDRLALMSNGRAVEYGIAFQNLSSSSSKKDKFIMQSLTVDKSSCVGLICKNRKISSSIFKMVIGAKRINTGDILINGKSVKYDSISAYKSLGYCSKDCNLFRHMTGRENLKMLGLIKGIPRRILKEAIEKLSVVL